MPYPAAWGRLSAGKPFGDGGERFAPGQYQSHNKSLLGLVGHNLMGAVASLLVPLINPDRLGTLVNLGTRPEEV